MMSRHRMPAEGDPRGSLLTQSWLEAGRLLTRWRRDGAVLMGSLLLPIGLLLLYEVVLGDRVQLVTGADSVYGIVPTVLVLSALFGALGNAIGLTIDRESRLLSKLWMLPVHRASALIGRLMAEAVRAFIGSVLITIIGVLFGLRFAHGAASVVLFLLIPSIVAVGFGAVVMALVVSSNGRTYTTWLAGATVAMTFVNPGITPIKLFPEWFQPFVRLQPIAPPIEVMRGLSLGGPIMWPLVTTLAWATMLLAICIPLAVRGYRLAAEQTA